MKDLIINGSQFLGVEEVLFEKVGGGTARFIDAQKEIANAYAAKLDNITIIPLPNIPTLIMNIQLPIITNTISIEIIE